MGKDQPRLDWLLRLPVVSVLVKRRLRRALGLNRARMLITAAAPMPDSLKAWYQRLDMDIQEIYGLTETCGGFTMTREGEDTAGTVGRALKGAEMKIARDSGEVLARGPWFMAGYYKDPVKTAC